MLMTLNVNYWSGIGKLLYCFFDNITALILRNILQNTTKLNKKEILKLLALWIFNPFVIYITIKGSD